MPRLSEICLYENIVCFLQDLSSSCQSNHIIFNSCQDLARSYKFKDLGKILNFEKATVHWLMAKLQSYPATQNISFFFFCTCEDTLCTTTLICICVCILACCLWKIHTFSHTGNSNFIVSMIFILDYRLGKPAFSSDTLPI